MLQLEFECIVISLTNYGQEKIRGPCFCACQVVSLVGLFEKPRRFTFPFFSFLSFFFFFFLAIAFFPYK